MAADTFLHTVDKRATPAIWRESVEKVEFEKETKKTLSGISQLIFAIWELWNEIIGNLATPFFFGCFECL